MDSLWPISEAELDVEAAVAAERRRRPDGRPWVTMMMIASIDGAAAVDGVSGGLGAPADKAVFGALRSIADAIVVGGGTAVAENYGPVPDRSETASARRVAAGQAAVPTLAVMSGSLPFTAAHRLFSDPAKPPVLYTTEHSDPTARDTLAACASVRVLPGDRVSPTDVVGDLGARGAAMILLEGGPRLNGSFLAAGLVDEVHLTVAPTLMGGDAPRIVSHPDVTPTAFALVRTWMGDGLLFHRWVRA